MKSPNPIYYNPQLQTFTCRGCRMRMEIPSYVYNSVEALAIARENLEHQHISQGCDEAMVKADAAAYKPGQTALKTAWGTR